MCDSTTLIKCSVAKGKRSAKPSDATVFVVKVPANHPLAKLLGLTATHGALSQATNEYL